MCQPGVITILSRGIVNTPRVKAGVTLKCPTLALSKLCDGQLQNNLQLESNQEQRRIVEQ